MAIILATVVVFVFVLDIVVRMLQKYFLDNCVLVKTLCSDQEKCKNDNNNNKKKKTTMMCFMFSSILHTIMMFSTSFMMAVHPGGF